jgi:hypothetical protein
LGIATKARCYHYGSITLDENKAMMNPILMSDIIEWQKIIKEKGREDNRDWKKLTKKLE